jgi:hypothetical protein
LNLVFSNETNGSGLGHKPVNDDIALLRVGKDAGGFAGRWTDANFEFSRFDRLSAFVASLNGERVIDTLSGSEKSELVLTSDFTLRTVA